MQNYHDLMAHVLEHGQYKPNRTKYGTIASVGHALRFDLREGFPAVTTKKLAFKAVVGELLGFFRGYDSAEQFRSLGCRVWDKNANETPQWLASEYRKGTDHLGRIYGVQWTRWRDTRYASSETEAQALQNKGYVLKAHDRERGVWVFEREINQLEEALIKLLTNPFDRRIVVSGWRLDEFDQMALPPCHVQYMFVAMPDGTLHSTLWQRSWDLFLGAPFNIAELALFTHIMARFSGLEAATATIFATDAHIYENHVEAVRTQLQREHFPPPRLVLSPRLKKVEHLDEVRGIFERIEPDDILLEGYESHPTIAAEMAA